MKTVLIISEYNPFHKGHKYQIDDVRREFGEDTAIISLMSGNYTQRGDIAIMDKFIRAQSAVLGGVNLVLMLPFPYSMSSAEFFAGAGVEIANRLGVVDVLAFGSENGDVNKLCEIAKNMLSPEFTSEIKKVEGDDDKKHLGYPKLCEYVYEKLFSSDLSHSFFEPNNILALEYIKALRKTKSDIIPYTTKRVGANYNAENIIDSQFQSATAIRKESFINPSSAAYYISDSSKNVFLEAFNSGKAPCDANNLSAAILSHFRLNSPSASCDIHDADGGLYNRLVAAGIKATDISSLIELASTKKYTTARIKRAIWYSFFGVTSSDVRTMPRYTQVLAMDAKGQALLKRIKKTTAFPIITKPSSTQMLDEVGLRQKMLSDKADFIFELSKPISSPADAVFKASPFIKKGE